MMVVIIHVSMMVASNVFQAMLILVQTVLVVSHHMAVVSQPSTPDTHTHTHTHTLITGCIHLQTLIMDIAIYQENVCVDQVIQEIIALKV